MTRRGEALRLQDEGGDEWMKPPVLDVAENDPVWGQTLINLIHYSFKASKPLNVAFVRVEMMEQRVCSSLN